MAKSLDLTNGNIKNLIIKLSFPVFISSLFNELYAVTNQVIVGNFVSLKALSAVSACTWICNIFNFTFYGLGMGAGILVARYYGAKDKTNFKKSLDTSIVFGVIGGLLLTLLSELCLPFLMKACNIGPDIYVDSYNYLRVYLLGNTFVLTSQMCFFILRSLGDTKHQLYYSIISSIINVIFGVLFVRVLHLDVVGTALATIISQIVMDVLALSTMFRYDGIDFSFKNIDFSFNLVKQICELGIPAGFQNMLIAISSMLIQSYINLFPNEVIAGIGVAQKVSNWGQMLACAVAASTMSLVAQNYGAEKYGRVQESIKTSLKLSSILTILSIIFIWVFCPYIVSLFNDSPDVAYYGTQMVRHSVFGMFFVNISHIYNGACRGAGNVKAPMVVAIAGQVISKYLFVYIGLKINFDVRILYIGEAFGYTMAGIFAYLYFHKSYWVLSHQLRA